MFARQLLEQCLAHSKPAVNAHFSYRWFVQAGSLLHCVDPDMKLSPYTLIYPTHILPFTQGLCEHGKL